VTISQLSAVKTMIIQQVTFLAKDFDNTEYQFSGTLFRGTKKGFKLL